MFLIFPETGVFTVQPVFVFGLCFSILSFLCNIWEIIVYPFSFGNCTVFCFLPCHWTVCSSSIYGFWLPLWYTSIKHRKMKTSNMNFTKIVKTCVLQKIEHSLCYTQLLAWWVQIIFFLGSENLPLVKYSKED